MATSAQNIQVRSITSRGTVGEELEAMIAGVLQGPSTVQEIQARTEQIYDQSRAVQDEITQLVKEIQTYSRSSTEEIINAVNNMTRGRDAGAPLYVISSAEQASLLRMPELEVELRESHDHAKDLQDRIDKLEEDLKQYTAQLRGDMSAKRRRCDEDGLAGVAYDLADKYEQAELKAVQFETQLYRTTIENLLRQQE